MQIRKVMAVGGLLAFLLGSFVCADQSEKSAQAPTSTVTVNAGQQPTEAASGVKDASSDLPEDALTAFQAMKSDPPPSKLAADVHFPASNERFLYLWRDAMQPLGGVFVGVGTDQNYVLAGWSRPQVLVLMDFDQMVVEINTIYRLMFLNAPEPETFIKLWSKKSLKEVKQIFEQAYPEKNSFDHMWKVYREVRRQIEIRLAVMVKDFREQKLPFFLSDREQYRCLGALFKQNRVFILRGDLTAKQAVQSIAAAAKTANIPVRVLYLSNAERYFPYEETFKYNILTLPFDERTVVLRTTGLGTWAKGDPFWYIIQRGIDFQEWLKSPKVVKVSQLLSQRKSTQKLYLFTISGLPPEPPPVLPKLNVLSKEKSFTLPHLPPRKSTIDNDSASQVVQKRNIVAPATEGAQ